MTKNGLSTKDKEIIGAAKRYELKKVPAVFRPVAEEFLDSLSLEEGDSVLDVACGTGIVARIIFERLRSPGKIVGVDIDSDMINVARANTPDNGAISWHVSSAEQMPFLESETFDWVLCQQGFQWFKDRLGALCEMRRVLRPGGRLAMIIWTRISPDTMPFYWLEIELIRKYGSEEAAQKRMNLTPFFKGNRSDLDHLMHKAGFRQIKIENRAFMRHKGPPETIITEDDYMDLELEARTAIVAEFRHAAEPFRTESGTTIPYGYHFVLGTR